MKHFIFAIGLAVTLPVASQNLVVNPSFEEVDGKIKDLAGIENAVGWKSPTSVQADLFSPDAKTELALTPTNNYGKEKPYRGNNYAGIKAYSYKEKEARSYLIGTLKETLKEGEPYCVKFQQSLSEDSKYAISNVAALFTSEPFEMGEMSYNIIMDPSVELNKPQIITRQLYWDDVCNVYNAKGDEKFLSIGTFVTEKQVEYKKIKRPADFKGQQQSYAYYYIDGVEVVPFKEGVKCDCEKEVFVDTPTIVRSTTASNVSEADVNKEIESIIIKFDNKSSQLDPAQSGVEEILKYLKLDSDLRLIIEGHIGDQEMKEGMKNPRIKTLAIARAKAVFNYLIEQKVDKTKLTTADKGSYDPIGNVKDADFNEKNQSVTFQVKTIQ